MAISEKHGEEAHLGYCDFSPIHADTPHDFSPDRESCTDAEVAFWEDAKKRRDAGERDVRGARSETVRNDQGDMVLHVTRTSWGIGVNSYECWEQTVFVEVEEGETL